MADVGQRAFKPVSSFSWAPSRTPRLALLTDRHRYVPEPYPMEHSRNIAPSGQGLGSSPCSFLLLTLCWPEAGLQTEAPRPPEEGRAPDAERPGFPHGRVERSPHPTCTSQYWMRNAPWLDWATETRD